MDSHARRRNGPSDEGPDPTRPDLELDLEVGRRIEEYRWVEWNRDVLGSAPLHEPGRFVGHYGDLLSHLYVDAAPEAPLGPQAYAHLPRYSSEPAPALRAAERAGLFAGEGALLSCTPGGLWRVLVERAAIEMDDDCLPRLLCRAALRLATDVVDGGRS